MRANITQNGLNRVGSELWYSIKTQKAHCKELAPEKVSKNELLLAWGLRHRLEV